MEEKIVYDVNLKDLPPRIAKVVEKLALSPKERFEKYGTLRSVANDIFRNDEGKPDKAYIAELKQEFLKAEDPTEYAFAVKVFKSWDLYERIKKDSSILREMLKKWHTELEIKLRSKALKNIVSKARSSSDAAKYLFEGKYREQLDEYRKRMQESMEDNDKVIYSIFSEAEDELEELIKEKANEKAE